MKLEASKEEILERFRICGEIFILCWEIADEDCRFDFDEDTKIEYDDICSELSDEDAPDDLFINIGDGRKEKCYFDGISYENGVLMINFLEDIGEGRLAHCGMPAKYVPSETLRQVLALLEKYAKEIGAQWF